VAVKRETELYAPIKAFFVRRGYEVKAEVLGCDLVAVRAADARPVIVEMKKTFTLPLLLQGIDRQRTGAEVWLAVERNRAKKGARNQRFQELTALCRRLSLGLITVTFYKTKEPAVEVWCEPGPIRASAGTAADPLKPPPETAGPAGSAYGLAADGRKRAGAAKIMKEFAARSGDYNTGGSSGRKLVTAYRERAIRCALALRCHGELPPREVGRLTGAPDAARMLRDNHYGWFRHVRRGVYGLTDAGHAALDEYEAVASVLAARYEWAAGWTAARAAAGEVSAASTDGGEAAAFGRARGTARAPGSKPENG